jgi:hypothetical protein
MEVPLLLLLLLLVNMVGLVSGLVYSLCHSHTQLDTLSFLGFVGKETETQLERVVWFGREVTCVINYRRNYGNTGRKFYFVGSSWEPFDSYGKFQRKVEALFVGYGIEIPLFSKQLSTTKLADDQWRNQYSSYPSSMMHVPHPVNNNSFLFLFHHKQVHACIYSYHVIVWI